MKAEITEDQFCEYIVAQLKKICVAFNAGRQTFVD